MRRLLNLLVSRLRLWRRGGTDAADGPDPRYGSSVSYVACPDCGEGSLVYDDDRNVSVCNACGAVQDGPE